MAIIANILVADIGGTKIAAASAAGVKMTSRVQVESMVKDAESLFESLLTAFSQVLQLEKGKSEDIEIISIGLPGLVDSENGVAVYQNNLPWRDFPLAARLKALFPNAEIVMDNDVYMAAFGEWKARQLEKETFAYVTVSTGISACIINDGQFIRGAGMAGEIGFTVLECDNEIKTLENLASGPAIEAEAKKIYSNFDLTTEKVMALYSEQDPKASEVVVKAARNIARGLHQLFSVLDPHIVVLGGGVINQQPLFFELMKEQLAPFIQNPIQKDIQERLQLSQFKGDSGLQGALLRGLDQVGKDLVG